MEDCEHLNVVTEDVVPDTIGILDNLPDLRNTSSRTVSPEFGNSLICLERRTIRRMTAFALSGE